MGNLLKMTTPDLQKNIKYWDEDLNILWQNRLLDEGKFIRFARDRGIAVYGVIEGDPGTFNRLGWLPHSALNYDGKLLFHPFRIYPLRKIIEACTLKISPSSLLNRGAIVEYIPKIIHNIMPSNEQIKECAEEWNSIADLAVLLEPVYWVSISGRQVRSAFIEEADFNTRLKEYKRKALNLVASLNPDYWKKQHEKMRLYAATIDDNVELYLFLRLSKWSRRKELKGQIAGALWIRHMAEVIRRAFEEVYNVQWPEEDQAFGSWSKKGRELVYGSERPLDDAWGSRPYLPFHFGLHTGSVVRWYVEGDTEYFAVLSIISEPAKVGIELVNLKGNIASEKDNIALKLKDCLEIDITLRRLSMISFDFDVPANIKAVRRQVEEKRIVGMIKANKPDFEFANFSVEELVEIAAQCDEEQGVSGEPIRNGDWTDIYNSREFEKRYLKISSRRPSRLKGKQWGEALAAYADKLPNRSDNSEERPFWDEIRSTLSATSIHYDYQKENYRFDPKTFKPIKSNNHP